MIDSVPGQYVISTVQDGVAVITLNRPGARNALNRQLLAELHGALAEATADDGVRVIVLTGAGTAFCAGADLKETAHDLDGEDFWSRYDRATQSMEIHRLLPQLPKPVIAAVNGYAVAGGCGLAMSCDLVVASDQAKFGYPEVSRGLVAAMVMVSLTQLVGRRQALDLLLSGRLIGAEEALRIGLINRVSPKEDLMSSALAYAAEIATKSSSALRLTKLLYRQVRELDSERGLEYARDINLLVRQTSDAQQGALSFGRSRSESNED
jgi:enoyl-CoA hydratase/carnithine racemase